jgi:hypothetical protein
MGCVFLGKMEPVMANAEIEKTLADTGEIKHGQRKQKAGLELQNRCSTTELNWLNGRHCLGMIGAGLGKKRFPNLI